MSKEKLNGSIEGLEIIAKLLLAFSILIVAVLIVLAFINTSVFLLLISYALGALIYGLLVYYFLLVFSGMAKDLVFIKNKLISREDGLVKQKGNKLENEQNLSSGIKAAQNYLSKAKKDHQFRMRVQKCINEDEHLQLAKKEGYIFTIDELNEAKEWLKKFEDYF